MSINLDKEITRGRQAQDILDSEIYKGAYESISEGLYSAWVNTLPEEKERREECWRTLKLLGTLERELGQHMVTGKMASEQKESNEKGFRLFE